MGGLVSTPPKQTSTTRTATSQPSPQGSCPPPVTDADYIIPPDNLTNCIPLTSAIRYELFQFMAQKQGTLRSTFPEKIPFKYGKKDICPLYTPPPGTKLFPCNNAVLDYCKANAFPTYTSVNGCILDLNRKGGTVPTAVVFTLPSATSNGRSLDTTVGTFTTGGLCKTITISGNIVDVAANCATASISIRRGTTRVVSKTFTFSRTGPTSIAIPIGVTVNAKDTLVFTITITKAGCSLTATNVSFRCEF